MALAALHVRIRLNCVIVLFSSLLLNIIVAFTYFCRAASVLLRSTAHPLRQRGALRHPIASIIVPHKALPSTPNNANSTLHVEHAPSLDCPKLKTKRAIVDLINVIVMLVELTGEEMMSRIKRYAHIIGI